MFVAGNALRSATAELTTAERNGLIRDALRSAHWCADKAFEDADRKPMMTRLGSWYLGVAAHLAEEGDRRDALLASLEDETPGLFLGDATGWPYDVE